jgi:hypothetical protein
MSQGIEELSRALGEYSDRFHSEDLAPTRRHYGTQVSTTESQFEDPHSASEIDQP